MTSPDPVDAVVFDLGGVLVRLGGVASMRELAGARSGEEVFTRWLACPWVRDFERGRCTADEFATGLVESWQLAVTPDEFLAVFAAWPEELFDGAAQLVADVRRQVVVASLSNTNHLHWAEVQGRWRIGEWFDHNLLSHQLGMVKPDEAVFERTATVLGCPPGHVLFLDDVAENVAAARAAGLAAVQVRGVEGARAALVEAGVLGSG